MRECWLPVLFIHNVFKKASSFGLLKVNSLFYGLVLGQGLCHWIVFVFILYTQVSQTFYKVDTCFPELCWPISFVHSFVKGNPGAQVHLTLFQQYKSFENTVVKGEISCNKQFLLFPQCFLSFWRSFCHFHQIQNCCVQTLSVWKSLKCVLWERVNSLPNDSFRLVQNESTCREQNRCGSKVKVFCETGRKHFWKRTKC